MDALATKPLVWPKQRHSPTEREDREEMIPTPIHMPFEGAHQRLSCARD